MPGPWRLVFMGTPEFAAPSLEALAGTGDEVVLTVCQPDRPAGRGRKLTPPPSKTLACDLDLPVCQPDSLKDDEIATLLSDLAPDLMVVVAFGQILPRRILDIPAQGVVNVHPSLLPAHRGPAPINWAILDGDKDTGVTTMLLDEGVDTGPILLSRRTAIGEIETAGELHDRLAVMGAELLLETIAGMKAGSVRPLPQPLVGVSHGRLLTKADGLIDWTRSAEDLARQVRGLDPWPGAYTTFNGKNLKLFGARPGPGRGEAGQVLSLDQGLLHVAAGRGSLALAELQPAGKKRQNAEQFWHGQRLTGREFFGA